ncbi:hypothetical protein ACFFHJ_16765 [Planotetraspora thailandica]|nr:hypothetical protein [Planotetraspora thailandica]
MTDRVESEMAEAEDGSPARKVGATELLNRREAAWSRRLRGSSLVAEVDIKDGHSEQVASVLGRVYAKWLASGRKPHTFFTRWPACVAVAMTAVAARHYRRGEFWRDLWTAVGYRGLPEEQSTWGKGFANAVDALGMPTFQGMPMPYVGPILMHTGIPTYCLEDYFRLIAHRRASDRGLDAEAFLAWATAPGTEHRLDNLDVPARRFLQHGTEFALDFVERTFDLLDRLRDPAPDLDGVALPPRVLARAQELAAERQLDLSVPSSSGESRTRAERPRIALDPFGRGVEVILPAVGDTPDGLATWTVTADGVTSTVRSRAQWVGVAEAAPATNFSLLKPVRTVVVALAGWQHQTELQVIDPAAPMLVFAEDGRRLPATMPLPPDVVWVVYPGEHELTTDGPLAVTIEGQLPLGWTGWRLRQVSLEGVRSLGLTELPGSRRPVRGYTRPRIVTGDPVAGVTTPYGSPVYARMPEVWLPGQEGAETTWQVDVRRVGSDEAVMSGSHTISGPLSITEIEDAFPSRPVLGAFDIVVRGPLGRGAKRTVFVAEGLGARFTPRVRLFGAAGLAQGKAELTAAVGAQAAPRAISYGSAELAAIAEYRTGEQTEPLVVTPPRVEVMHEREAEPPIWRAGPLRIPADSFADAPGALLVRVPETRSALPSLHVVVGGNVVQDLPASGRPQEGTARFDLVKIADTVAEHKQADLLLEVGSDVIRVGSVRPRQLAYGAEREGDHLRLINHVPVDGLTAGIYPTTAPWREPIVEPVGADGSVPLPVELRDAGPLLVLLQVDDPWVPVEWPRWPKQYLMVGGDGHVISDDPEETALSRFISGEGDFPHEVDGLWRVWTMIDLAERLRPASDLQRFIMTCSRPIQRRPFDALTALVGLGLKPARTLACIISSGLAATAVPDLANADAARRMWPVVPAVAALAGGLQDEDCFAAAERQCGEAFREIVVDGVDSFAGVGRFGADADRLVHMTPQQIEGIWRAANVVPRALLDADTRASAARRLFDARGEEAAREVGSVALYAVKTAEAVLRRLERLDLLPQLDQRRNPDGRAGWRSLPAASIAFAMVARLAARGDAQCRTAEQTFRADWTRLAAIAPDLVTIDLVLAELLVGQAETEMQ